MPPVVAQGSEAEWSAVQGCSPPVYCSRQLAAVLQRYSFGVSSPCAPLDDTPPPPSSTTRERHGQRVYENVQTRLFRAHTADNNLSTYGRVRACERPRSVVRCSVHDASDHLAGTHSAPFHIQFPSSL